NLFIKHTSAGITINENADPSVPIDLENSINALVKENESFYTHTQEGSDDMPAHIKSSLIGCSLTIPIQNYQLALGVWQGIYLCEFRDYGGHRKILSTIYS
ncbi:MAG: YjbQ family protein, partial [Bacteroidetes bacterium]|nr:YjbQ family protein [Bacteroidota bacterium]